MCIVLSYQRVYKLSLYLLKTTSVFGTDTDNPMINTFTYVTTSILPSTVEAAELGDAFWGLFFVSNTDLAQVLSDDMVVQSIEITSPYDPTVLAILVVNESGLSTAANQPRFLAIEFRSPRTRTDIRGGFKRFGVTTEGIVNGEAIDAGALTLIANIRDQLGTVLNYTLGGAATAATPAIVKRIPYTTPSGSTAYRLPSSDLELEYSPATAWVYWRVTTQNSRKQ